MNKDSALNVQEEKNDERLHKIVIGLGDGLTIPFALAAGLSNVVDSNNIIITAGIIAIAAGSVAMGIGGVSAIKTSQKEFQLSVKKEYEEPEPEDSQKMLELKKFYKELGLSESMQHEAAEDLSKEKDDWDEFIKKYEPAIAEKDKNEAARSGFTIAAAYIIGGLIPLLPYVFINDTLNAFYFSIAVTLCCLFVSGWLKSRFTGLNSWSGGFRMMLTGATAAAAAYIVAKIFMN